MTLRRFGRRFAWLMAGAAIGTTVLLVLALVVPFGLDQQRISGPLLVLGVAGAVLLGGLLGLVPGVRELEVTAARSMLEVRSELVVPARPGPVHHLQVVVLVQLHLLLGLLAAAALMMLLPFAAVTLLTVAGMDVGPETLAVPEGALGAMLLAAASMFAIALAALSSWPLGALAARAAARLLGPTSRDRLALALSRVEREAERTRIARDLHDGIGHALTVVSIQAAAGGRVLERDPRAAREVLDRIESTAREALVELDGVLADLREDRRAATPEGSTAQSGAAGDRQDGASVPRLRALLEDHRRTGMDLRAHLALPADLSALQGEHLARITAELLTNAHRHGGTGPVELTLGEGTDAAGERAVILEVCNPLPQAPSADGVAPEDSAPGGLSPETPRGGRGLPGLRERLDLWGGTLEAGPLEAGQNTGAWRARAVLPLLTERPPR